MNPFVNFKKIREEGLEKSNSKFNVHDRYKGLSVPELQEISNKDRLPWHTMALNLTGDLNVGTIIRTSHCLGAKSVLITGRTKIDNRSLVGAANYIKVEKIKALNEDNEFDTKRIFDIFRDFKLVPIFCESNGINFNKINWKMKFSEISNRGHELCLVMGNESGGIPSNILDLEREMPNSITVSIPQKGIIRSFNVAIAHSIIASHICTEMDWI